MNEYIQFSREVCLFSHPLLNNVSMKNYNVIRLNSDGTINDDLSTLNVRDPHSLMSAMGRAYGEKKEALMTMDGSAILLLPTDFDLSPDVQAAARAELEKGSKSKAKSKK